MRKVERAAVDRLPIPFSLPEVVALLASRDMLDRKGAGPFSASVASAFGKIEALMTPLALALVARMRKSVGARSVGAQASVLVGFLTRKPLSPGRNRCST